ncbi:MAG TPA: carboxypeptidase-like regulatory domain-containing protein [Pyrinomonadaceae bacterium]|nr:carboxypeptidase-like regulatory domain-containing protein [Pyrinomonadaceae bacterium]
MKTILKFLTACLIVLSFSIAAAAATFVVNNTGDTLDSSLGDGVCADAGSVCSLRAAIAEANALAGADTITLPAGVFTQSIIAASENANGGGDWDITGDLTINGAGEDLSVVQAAATPGTAAERVLDIQSGTVVLSGITVRHGSFSGAFSSDKVGAGIRNLSTLTLDHCLVTLNETDFSGTGGGGFGVGVYNGGPSLTLEHTSVVSNTDHPTSGGGNRGVGVSSFAAATIIINNSSISQNSSTSPPFPSPISESRGIGLYVQDTFDLTITNSHIDNNTMPSTSNRSAGVGMSLITTQGPSSIHISNVTFNNNIGGATQVDGLGAHIGTTGFAPLTGTIDRMTVDGNQGHARNGGGLSLQISGAVMNLDFTNCQFTNNNIPLISGRGGGISVENGGGNLLGPSTINFTNTTISKNSAIGGGGVYVQQFNDANPVNINFNFTTIADNFAFASVNDGGGGLYHVPAASGIITFKNSVIAQNTSASAPDISGTVKSLDYNHFGNTSGSVIIQGPASFDTRNVAAMLGPLQDNGGGVLTHFPLPGSILRDTIPNGTSGCGTPVGGVTADVRGLARPSGSACDKGAVEALSLPAGPWQISGIVKDSGNRPLRNVAVVLSGEALLAPVTVVTGSLGQYGFLNLPGANYSVSISSKRYTFAPDSQSFVLSTDVANADFIADSGGLRIKSEVKSEPAFVTKPEPALLPGRQINPDFQILPRLMGPVKDKSFR